MSFMTASEGIEALKRAIKYVGSQEALAARIGTTQQAISYWITTSQKVPAEHVIPIEEATDGTVKRRQLRSDIYQ